MRGAVLILSVLLISSAFSPLQTSSITFSTYVGGSSEDTARDTSVDPATGNIYVTGGTKSANFLKTVGPGYGGVHDCWIRSYSPTGQLIASRLVGGPNYDRCYAVEVKAGFVTVAGRAGTGLPTTAGVLQPNFAGDSNPNLAYGTQDGFVARFSLDLATEHWKTYFGEGSRGFIRDIDVLPDGRVALVQVDVSGTNPHVTSGAFQTTPGGLEDSVVAVMSANGQAVEWASYIGGLLFDLGTASIRVLPDGRVAALGITQSPNFPTTANAADPTHNGMSDMALVIFKSDGSGIDYSTFIGGSQNDYSETHGLAVDSAGNLYAAITTRSTGLPTTAGAYDATHNGNGGSGTGSGTNNSGDVYIVKFSPQGVRLAATYYGGQYGEGVEGVSVGDDGRIYISGGTYSPNLPVVNAYQPVKSGGADQFAAVFSNDLTQLIQASFIGGSGADYARASTLGSGFVVVGNSTSTNFPRVSAHQNTYGGATDGTVTVFPTSVPMAPQSTCPCPSPTPLN